MCAAGKVRCVASAPSAACCVWADYCGLVSVLICVLSTQGA
jgi:hypothetical protein